MFLNCSTCFEQHTAHHQELKTLIGASGFTYVCGCLQPQTYVKPEVAVTVLSSWWWAMCCPKHVEQLRNMGIIYSTTRSHLVRYFYTIYIMMHGSMNIKSSNSVCTSTVVVSPDSPYHTPLTSSAMNTPENTRWSWWPWTSRLRRYPNGIPQPKYRSSNKKLGIRTSCRYCLIIWNVSIGTDW